MSITVEYTLYHKTTGEILRHGVCSDTDLQHQRENTEQAVYPATLNDADWYLPNGIVTARPVLGVSDVTIPADGEEHVILADVPAGTEVFMDEVSFGMSESDLLLMQATVPGVVKVRLEPPFPYQERAEFEVTINEAS